MATVSLLESRKGAEKIAQEYVETPVFDSEVASKMLSGGGAKRKVYLKMDAFQPAGSFKLRGMSHWITSMVAQGTARELVSSSGGNAGYAAAYVAKRLGLPITVFLPETTPGTVREALKLEGANVTVGGIDWSEAHAAAQAFAGQVPDRVLVHPFDHPLLWEGHASIVRELRKQLREPPDAIVVAVGGGGLMAGIGRGLNEGGEDDPWKRVKIVAVETEGAACLHASIKAREKVTLERINTIASSLGARAPCEEALRLALGGHPGGVISLVCTDEEAVRAVQMLAESHRVLVEPACGAALSVVLRRDPALDQMNHICVIVCGGINTHVAQLRA